MGFWGIVKLFIRFYPILKKIAETTGSAVLDLKVDLKRNRVEMIFKDQLKPGVTDEDVAKHARKFNDIFK